MSNEEAFVSRRFYSKRKRSEVSHRTREINTANKLQAEGNTKLNADMIIKKYIRGDLLFSQLRNIKQYLLNQHKQAEQKHNSSSQSNKGTQNKPLRRAIVVESPFRRLKEFPIKPAYFGIRLMKSTIVRETEANNNAAANKSGTIEQQPTMKPTIQRLIPTTIINKRYGCSTPIQGGEERVKRIKNDLELTITPPEIPDLRQNRSYTVGVQAMLQTGAQNGNQTAQLGLSANSGLVSVEDLDYAQSQNLSSYNIRYDINKASQTMGLIQNVSPNEIQSKRSLKLLQIIPLQAQTNLSPTPTKSVMISKQSLPKSIEPKTVENQSIQEGSIRRRSNKSAHNNSNMLVPMSSYRHKNTSDRYFYQIFVKEDIKPQGSSLDNRKNTGMATDRGEIFQKSQSRSLQQAVAIINNGSTQKSVYHDKAVEKQYIIKEERLLAEDVRKQLLERIMDFIGELADAVTFFERNKPNKHDSPQLTNQLLHMYQARDFARQNCKRARKIEQLELALDSMLSRVLTVTRSPEFNLHYKIQSQQLDLLIKKCCFDIYKITGPPATGDFLQ